MSFRLRHPSREEEDWVIVARDWWRTSFQDVPWSYVSRSAAKSQRKSFHGSLFCNPPSRTTISSMSKENRTLDENDSINVELVGVMTALEVVAGYERDVGFYFTTLPNLPSYDVPAVDLSITVDEKGPGKAKKQWDEQLEDLMNGPTGEDSDDSSLSSSGELHRSTSTFSSMSSIDSIGMPSTPKPKSFFSDIEIKVASPQGSIDYNLSPTRSLNAAASSFVPTFCPQLNDEPLQFPTLEERPKTTTAEDPFANFTFPTLNLHSPMIKVKKDDTGAVNEAQDTRNDLLPPFLQDPSIRTRTRKSRTREIVDRLRSRMSLQEESSAPQPQLSPKYASHSPSPTVGEEIKLLTPRLSVSEDGGDRLPSPCEEDDGWMDASQSSVMSPNNKSKRARELMFALTRRRTDSLPSETAKEKEATPAASETSPQNTSPSPSPSPPLLTASDGWIESSPKRPSEPQKKAAKQLSTLNPNPTHNHKKSSNHVSRTSTSSQPHPHSHSHQYSTSSPGYPAHPAVGLPHMLSTPMLPGGQALPYFFPTYPAVNIPMQYTAFMQMPAYHLGVAMQQQPMVGPNPALQYTLSPPMGVPLRTGSSMKPPTSAAAVGNLNISPAFRSKHSPVW